MIKGDGAVKCRDFIRPSPVGIAYTDEVDLGQLAEHPGMISTHHSNTDYANSHPVFFP